MAVSGPHRVTLEWRDGRTATVEVDAGETVVNAAEDAGVGVPYGCLTGACATCTGRLLDGDLTHRREPRALKPRHRDAGYVLLCIAEPRSDARVRVGADVQAELVENPWK
ncbi:MAG: 2Fe-2S iron-sulfur cluster-binding protein [Haloferacaceae archaeon]